MTGDRVGSDPESTTNTPATKIASDNKPTNKRFFMPSLSTASIDSFTTTESDMIEEAWTEWKIAGHPLTWEEFYERYQNLAQSIPITPHQISRLIIRGLDRLAYETIVYHGADTDRVVNHLLNLKVENK